MTRLGDREEAECRLLGSGTRGVLEHFPRPGEVDDVGAVGEHEGDRDRAAGGGRVREE